MTMANKLLVNRLDKRVTITRSYQHGEWPASTEIDLSKTFDGGIAYDGSDPAQTVWEDIVGPSGNRDEYGQPLEDEIVICQVWSAIEPLRGREYFAAMAEHAEVTTRIRIRYREGVDRTMFVRYKDQVFEILHIIHPDYAKRELHLMCKERQ